MCDKNDEIIPLQASLMVSVARELCHHQRIRRQLELKKSGVGLVGSAAAVDRIGMLCEVDLRAFHHGYSNLLEVERELAQAMDRFREDLKRVAAT